jgi:hypothetical protein
MSTKPNPDDKEDDFEEEEEDFHEAAGGGGEDEDEDDEDDEDEDDDEEEGPTLQGNVNVTINCISTRPAKYFYATYRVICNV